MSYTILYSDPAKNNNPIIVNDGSLNQSDTSLTLVGKNYPGYGQVFETDLVHILENFAATSPPTNPIEGQLWFDTSNPTNKKLRINDGGVNGARWTPINGIYQQPTEPTTVAVGDIWVDTSNQQLKIFNGSTFTLIGPNYSDVTRTGSYPSVLMDIGGVEHNVVINYVNDNAIEIITSETFTPNPIIDGFSTLSPGINISSANVGTIASPSYPQINGIADSASNLQITIPTNQTVSANAFLRNDSNQRMSGTLNIAKDGNSLQIGESPTFILSRDSQYNAIFSNIYNGGIFTFKLNNTAGIPKSVVTIVGENQRVGINNTGPVAELDVAGSLNVSSSATVNTLYVTSTAENIEGLPNNAVQVQGGVGIKGTLNVKGEHILIGPLTIGLSPVTAPASGYTATSVLNPSRNYIDIPYDIGSPDVSWRNIYAVQFQGPTGVTAQFVGNATSAVKFQQAKALRIVGDMQSPIVSFDGSQGAYYFTATVQSSLITGRSSLSTSAPADSMLVYNTSTSQLYQQTKKNFLKDVNYYDTTGSNPGYSTPSGSLVPVGTRLPYAGATPPPGWLLCDGSAVLISDYQYLCTNVLIGYPYGGSGASYNLPNLTGLTPTTGTTITYIIKY